MFTSNMLILEPELLAVTSLHLGHQFTVDFGTASPVTLQMLTLVGDGQAHQVGTNQSHPPSHRLGVEIGEKKNGNRIELLP